MILSDLTFLRGRRARSAGWLLAAVFTFGSSPLAAQSCQTGDDIDPATRSSLEATARRYFDLAAKGDAAALRQNSISSVAANFAGIESAVKDNQANMAGVQPVARPPFVLLADATAPPDHAEFYCGVFGAKGQTSSSAVFALNQLPLGKYGVVILDVPAVSGAMTISQILQQAGSDWKLGGWYVKAAQSAGHDSAWFVAQARAFQAKGQIHNAWYYFLQARDLASPLPFMSTMTTDRLYDESQKIMPSDLPGEKPVELTKDGKTYRIKTMFPYGVAGEINLVVKWEAADVSNTVLSYADNQAVAKALLARYPELREGFAAIVPRATEASGRDYGTLVPVKEIK
jgi:hypothetical protein